MMDLSRDAVTIMSELSMGVAIAVTMSVWALIVPRGTSPSPAMVAPLPSFFSSLKGFWGARVE